MPHGSHIYAKAYYMLKATICEYTQSDYVLPHYKCVLRCCSKCPSINLPDQETYDEYHIYHLIARCTTHGRLMLNDKKLFCKYKQDYVLEQSTKYTQEKS